MSVVVAQAAPGLASGQVIAFVLVNVALILAAARFCGSVARRVGQPLVVGEIIAGILLGPTLLGPAIFLWQEPFAFLDCGVALAGTGLDPSITSCLFPPQSRAILGAIGQIGLLLFTFLVGLELDFEQLKGKGRGIAVLSAGVVAVPVALGFLLQPVLYTSTFTGSAAPSAFAFNLFIGAFISVTAFPVMVRILQEKGLTTSDMGAVGIAAAAVVTVLMFLLSAVAGSVAQGAGAGEIGQQIALSGLYLGVMVLAVRPLLAILGRHYEEAAAARGVIDAHGTWAERDEHAPSGVGYVLTNHMFAVVLVVVFASGFVAHVLGLNVIVGGFVAGAVMPARQGLIRDMNSELFSLVAIVLLPIFLAFSGLNTDFTQLTGMAVFGIAVFTVASIVGKWPTGAIFARMGGLSFAEGNVLGILMNCRGLLPLVVALVGLQSGVISPVMQLGAVVMALLTTIMTGPLFDRIIASATAAAAADADVQPDPSAEPSV